MKSTQITINLEVTGQGHENGIAEQIQELLTQPKPWLPGWVFKYVVVTSIEAVSTDG